MLGLVYGLYTGEEYPTNGWTSVLYAISFKAGFLDLIFIFRKLGDRLEEVVMFCSCFLKDRLLLISLPNKKRKEVPSAQSLSFWYYSQNATFISPHWSWGWRLTVCTPSVFPSAHPRSCHSRQLTKLGAWVQIVNMVCSVPEVKFLWSIAWPLFYNTERKCPAQISSLNEWPNLVNGTSS